MPYRPFDGRVSSLEIPRLMSNLLPGAQEGRTECEPELPGEGKNLWRDLKRDVKQQREPILDLWQNLRDQMNLAKKKPKQLIHC